MSTRRLTTLGVGLAVLGGTVAACGSHNTASAIRPKDPSSTEALGQPGCPSEPWTLDMSNSDIGKYEQDIVNKRIAVVAQDCTAGTFKLLPDCTVQGEYAYTGSAGGTQSLTLDNTDQLKASFTNPTFLASANAELNSGVKMEIDYADVGTTRATPGFVKSDLKAEVPGACDGATHYVISMEIGAYTTKKAAGADVKGNATVAGQGASGASTSNTSSERNRGSLSDCASASLGDGKPPGKCNAVLQLRIVPLQDASSTPAAAQAKSTGGGSGGATANRPKRPAPPAPPPPPIGGVTYRTCQQGDGDGCVKACTKLHDGASCAILGFMYEKGKGVDADQAKAAAAYAAGCEAGNLDACAGFGTALSKGDGVPKDDAKAQDILSLACAHNSARACSGLGNRARVMGDQDKALIYLGRACNLGYARACFYAANVMLMSQGPSPLAFGMAMRGCSGKDLRGCLLAGSMIGQGIGVPANAAAGDKLGGMALDGLDAACQADDGDMEACEVLGDWFAGWYMNPKRDKAKAISYYKVACDGNQKNACDEAKHPAPPPKVPPPTQNASLPPPPPPPPPPANFGRTRSGGTSMR